MSPREVLAKHTSMELSEWEAFYEIEPFGPRTESWLLAQIAATLININRKKGKTPVHPEDLLPWEVAQKTQRPPDVKTMEAYFKSLHEHYSGKAQRNKDHGERR